MKALIADQNGKVEKRLWRAPCSTCPNILVTRAGDVKRREREERRAHIFLPSVRYCTKPACSQHSRSWYWLSPRLFSVQASLQWLAARGPEHVFEGFLAYV